MGCISSTAEHPTLHPDKKPLKSQCQERPLSQVSNNLSLLTKEQIKCKDPPEHPDKSRASRVDKRDKDLSEHPDKSRTSRVDKRDKDPSKHPDKSPTSSVDKRDKDPSEHPDTSRASRVDKRDKDPSERPDKSRASRKSRDSRVDKKEQHKKVEAPLAELEPSLQNGVNHVPVVEQESQLPDVDVLASFSKPHPPCLCSPSVEKENMMARADGAAPFAEQEMTCLQAVQSTDGADSAAEGQKADQVLELAQMAQISDTARAADLIEAPPETEAALSIEAVESSKIADVSEAALVTSDRFDQLGPAELAETAQTDEDVSMREQDGPNCYKVVMGKYKMGMREEDVAGEGSYSICRLGIEIATGAEVAIKVYKEGNTQDENEIATMMFKFQRQVETLKFLQEPFAPVADQALWNEQLALASPTNLFMRLVDYSQDKDGKPAPHEADGIVYVVTELAQYSLKDLIASHYESGEPPSDLEIQVFCRAIIKVVAGLHAKGMVHLDLKPENLMLFDGDLKLIDVDGCVKLGSRVLSSDTSIAFSPCYCAPEWAEFMISGEESTIVTHGLDAWSVGMTVCELVHLKAIQNRMYRNFLRNSVDHGDAAFLFLEWLSELKKCPLPESVSEFDPGFVDLVSNWLLVCDKEKRKSCAQSLTHPYLKMAHAHHPDNRWASINTLIKIHKAAVRHSVDDSRDVPLHKGMLFKLDSNADPKIETSWRKRDMWLTKAGSICYFSVKQNKGLVIVDGSKLGDGSVHAVEGTCMPHAFQVQYKAEDEDEAWMLSVFLACESAKECKIWILKIKEAAQMDVPPVRLGGKMKRHQKEVVAVKNWRLRCSAVHDSNCWFEPVFKQKLWKLKTEGDPMKEDDWLERDMWLSKNGSLVYYSKKEERNLIYYTSADLMRATVKLLERESIKPYGFQVQLPMDGGICFAPGEFAASDEASRALWMSEFDKFQEDLMLVGGAETEKYTGATMSEKKRNKVRRKKTGSKGKLLKSLTSSLSEEEDDHLA